MLYFLVEEVDMQVRWQYFKSMLLVSLLFGGGSVVFYKLTVFLMGVLTPSFEIVTPILGMFTLAGLVVSFILIPACAGMSLMLFVMAFWCFDPWFHRDHAL